MPIGTWHAWLGTYVGIVHVTMAALPVALLVVGALARWRRASGSPAAWAWRASAAEVGLVYGTLPWVWLTMLPGSEAGEVSGRVSLVPLRDLATMPAFQVVGNLLVLAALGFLGPVRFASLASLRRVLVLAATSSALIETAQYVLRLDRVSSVDDVLLNTAGAGLAALASRRWWRRRQPPGTRFACAPTTGPGAGGSWPTERSWS
ncbi:VanZ family protein [Nocardioides sp. CER19]|uniref:VanZ family protein n=1 Tax=Nocardioides sp. CER19 TaxID=3038538 RepID=UPI00244D76A7|nr:VanZ family protein [Nocardioides sp. CER19]MDH2415952.1 VanZ family protein [Nocardioides sp. CER19]